MSTTNLPCENTTTFYDSDGGWHRIKIAEPPPYATVQTVQQQKMVVQIRARRKTKAIVRSRTHVATSKTRITGPLAPGLGMLCAVAAVAFFAAQGNGLGVLLAGMFVVPFGALSVFNLVFPDKTQ